MARVIERADQLVLEYVSKVADVSHGVLRTDQRLAFVTRLRARIEQDRRGSDDLATVRKVIARFGDPGVLLQRELQRLAAADQEAARHTTSSPSIRPVPSPRSRPAPTPPGEDFGDSATEIFPAVVDDATEVVSQRPARPMPRGSVPVSRRGAPRAVPAPMLTRLRRAAMAGANPMATDGRDARTILLNDRREVVGMALLVLAALLVPFPLPYVAIFPMPVLVWAAGALTVLACEGWIFKDRLTGLVAPVAAYLVGGLVLGAIRAPEAPGVGLQAFISSFWAVSGLMFMLGTAGGVFWLAHRLLNPPPPPPRRLPLGTVR
jgi:hypothetical protein